MVNGGADLNPPYYAVHDTVTLTISASDESGIDSVKLYINGFARFSPTWSGLPECRPFTYLTRTIFLEAMKSGDSKRTI